MKSLLPRVGLLACSLLTTCHAYGQAALSGKAKADSVYEAEIREIAQRKSAAKAADSLALAKYLGTVKSTAEPGEEISAIDSKNGFRDLKFGAPVKQVRGLVAYGKPSQGEQMYTRPADSKKVGDATLAAVFYTFYKGRLEAVTLETKGFANGQAVLAALSKLYGNPSKPNPYLEEYVWFGNKVMASFKQNPVTDKGTVYIISKVVSSQMSADREKMAKKAASDL